MIDYGATEHDDNDGEHVDLTLKLQMQKHAVAGDNPMLIWRDERDQFIEEFLNLEAPHCDLDTHQCPNCKEPVLNYF
ncbi:hypothetical protein BDN71DRAFT_1509323 [Pleurotus eryngii]|uniref:Uncharacterized protein n=1 Tax=Pleurotus eryngii TaxID=5323 RepID=A0A9P5ZT09_PLEER|nr:hypothetical protein BDN71DRAFT_1509323 [Pleurotus eryngii]